ncbi:glycosyltransferase [Bryobacter aggregatus]|uniref:glycosyltransferase n=1 Tax=Bryobacter aggregatus TaxID=360054 RepID=UPI0004E15C61|nr:glycosyltransferase [Bryobacter aggregatus]
MRIAFFSPLPPVRSGIADYSAAILEPLKHLAEIETFETPPPAAQLKNFDVLLYQMGNNEYHSSIYECALEHPGVIVLHEGNLHHLHAERTIKQGNWDAYMEGVAFDGGPAAAAFAQRVRRLEVGPDYEGVPMLRRLLANARGVIVHSDCVAQSVREAGYTGPVTKIWHGAWIDRDPTQPSQREEYRSRLGLTPSSPLVGIFGFLKPYKRIAESLRAFRRLLRLQPDARMILCGDPHPDLDLENLLRSLQLEESVRVLGYLTAEDFHSYLEATDIVLNLRYPTVGESSGTLLRAFSLGKPVLVTDIGSFSEYPDEICLKVPSPPNTAEEDTIFEFLNLLCARASYRKALGNRARRWVEQECPWDVVAHRYVDFLDRVQSGKSGGSVARAPVVEVSSVEVPAPYILSWAQDEGGKQYTATHITRFTKTLALTPPGDASKSILEMGAYMQITPALKHQLGYGTVRGCYYGPSGKTDHHEIVSENGEKFECDVDLFDAEKDHFPYPDASFDTVLCCELLEHLTADPMHMMSEIHRILKPGGSLLITTPNIASLRALNAILQGYHPSFFPAYILPRKPGEDAEARHNREYTAKEVHLLFWESGFEVTKLETGEFLETPHPEHHYISHLLEQYNLTSELRGDGIYCVGRKVGPIRNRYPGWLYA